MINNGIPDLKYLFEPRSVAIVGASKDEWKSGGMFINSMLKDSYDGTIYPINPKESEIMGLKCYPALADIPGEIDLAILAIPSTAIIPAMQECARKRVKFAVVHAVGFSEMGAVGRDYEKKMVDIAHEGGVRIIGPNCMGIFTSRGRVNTVVPYARLPLEPGGVAFVGQSGWASETMLRLGSSRGLRFSGIISIGNQSDLRVEDLIGYWGGDPHTKVIAAYVEGLKNARRFMEIARDICPHKPVIIWKGGSSQMGARSAASHTGSLAGDYEVFQAMCRQVGIIAAKSMEDAIDLAAAFNCPVLPSGRRVGLLIEAGGGAVASSDAAAREGLTIPELAQQTQDRLAAYLKDKVPPSTSRKNPVDLVWVPIGDTYGVYADCLEMILSDVDACVMVAYGFLQIDQFRSRIVEMRDRLKKPVLYVPGNPSDQVLGTEMAVKDGIPVYIMPEHAIHCLGAMVRRAEYLEKMRALKEAN
ncbi:MAG: CoA-binding protein [Dehalococcoidia bacterium]|jgi:acetyltransferase